MRQHRFLFGYKLPQPSRRIQLQQRPLPLLYQRHLSSCLTWGFSRPNEYYSRSLHTSNNPHSSSTKPNPNSNSLHHHGRKQLPIRTRKQRRRLDHKRSRSPILAKTLRTISRNCHKCQHDHSRRLPFSRRWYIRWAYYRSRNLDLIHIRGFTYS